MTTHCPQCQTVLQVPPEAAGRRLRCPKPGCGHRFYADGGERPASSSGSQPSSMTLPPARGHSDLDLPVAAGDLRETFDLPLLSDEAPPTRAKAVGAAADAAALFQDDEPVRRRPRGAEARAQPRRCSCGNVVPAGMSLCSRCGLDLDTGRRTAVEEMLDDTPPPVVQGPSTPFGLLLIGALGFISSAILTVVSIISYFNGVAGTQLLAVVCLFGVFASYQLLRGKSARPLMIALALGAAIDCVTLIILPAWTAQARIEEPAIVSPADLAGDPDEERIPSYNERLEQSGGYRKITWGIAILLVEGAAFVYLCTAGVSRHFERQRIIPGGP